MLLLCKGPQLTKEVKKDKLIAAKIKFNGTSVILIEQTAEK